MRKKGSENYCHNLTLFIKCRQGGGDGNGAPKVVRKKGVKSIPPLPPTFAEDRIMPGGGGGKKITFAQRRCCCCWRLQFGTFQRPPPFSHTGFTARKMCEKQLFLSSLSSLISQCAGINNQEERGVFFLHFVAWVAEESNFPHTTAHTQKRRIKFEFIYFFREGERVGKRILFIAPSFHFALGCASCHS